MTQSFEHMILDAIIRTSNNNITIADEKGNILHSNPEHWTVYGIEPDYYIGKSVYELEAEGILTPSIIAMVIKEQKKIQIMQHTKIGKILMSTAYPIFDEDGKIVRIISYAQDQTEILNLHEQYERLENKVKGYQTEVEKLRLKEGIVYRSKAIEQIIKTIHQVADTDAAVLLLGESGVGKSMFAHSIHQYSHRRKEPFIELNCSTIPENLFESEMFGYEPGSFTGAQKQGKQGIIQQAHNGTLFLDEIGELPLSIQVKLLKVIQEKKFLPIGGKNEIQVDFRLVTATNQNLEEMVRKGTFRLDLYYRLNVIPLHIPSLRERKEDITSLINHYLKLMNNKYHTLKTLHSSTYDILIQYNWPGNVRELENVIERLILTTEETIISPKSLPLSIRGQISSEEKASSNFIEPIISDELDLKSTLEKVEKIKILKAYKECKSSYEMAKVLGISQPSVIRKLKKYKEDLEND
jgi:transcriptional regulator with PAS, ATPase and Fis domain